MGVHFIRRLSSGRSGSAYGIIRKGKSRKWEEENPSESARNLRSPITRSRTSTTLSRARSSSSIISVTWATSTAWAPVSFSVTIARRVLTRRVLKIIRSKQWNDKISYLEIVFIFDRVKKLVDEALCITLKEHFKLISARLADFLFRLIFLDDQREHIFSKRFGIYRDELVRVKEISNLPASQIGDRVSVSQDLNASLFSITTVMISVRYNKY